MKMFRLYLPILVAISLITIPIANADNDWNTYLVKGKYTSHNYKPEFQVFKIQYQITGGDVEEIEYSDKFVSIVAKIITYSDGFFEIKIPRNLPMNNLGMEDEFFILIDGKEIRHEEKKDKCLKIISLPFQNGSKIIEILGSMTLGSDPVRSIEVPPDCITRPSPKYQIENGALPEEIICAYNLVLVKKLLKNTVACVKPMTAEKLVQRGWGTMFSQKSTLTEKFIPKEDAVKIIKKYYFVEKKEIMPVDIRFTFLKYNETLDGVHRFMMNNTDPSSLFIYPETTLIGFDKVHGEYLSDKLIDRFVWVINFGEGGGGKNTLLYFVDANTGELIGKYMTCPFCA